MSLESLKNRLASQYPDFTLDLAEERAAGSGPEISGLAPRARLKPSSNGRKTRPTPSQSIKAREWPSQSNSGDVGEDSRVVKL